MQRLSPYHRLHQSMLSAVASTLSNFGFLRSIGLGDAALASMALDTYYPTGGYRTPPHGTSKRSVAGERCKAMKRRAIVRARKLGHA